MDLQEFVKQTLVQISCGVKEAQDATRDVGAFVNPDLSSPTTDAAKHGLLLAENDYAQIVQFDVALSVSDSKGTKGGIGVLAGAITLGSSGQSNAENSSVSRVKFVVPLVLPKP